MSGNDQDANQEKAKIKRRDLRMSVAMDLLDKCLHDVENVHRPVTMFKARVFFDDIIESVRVLVSVFPRSDLGVAALYSRNGNFINVLDMPDGVVAVLLEELPIVKLNLQEINQQISKCIMTTFIAMLSWKKVDYVRDYMLDMMDELLDMVSWSPALQIQLVSLLPFRTLTGGFFSVLDLSREYAHVPFAFFVLESSTVDRSIFDEASDLNVEVLKVPNAIFDIMNAVKIAYPMNMWFVNPTVKGFRYFVDKKLPTVAVRSRRTLDELINAVIKSECSIQDAVTEAAKWYPCRRHFSFCNWSKWCKYLKEYRLERIFECAIEQDKTKKPIPATTRYDFEPPSYTAHSNMLRALESGNKNPTERELDKGFDRV